MKVNGKRTAIATAENWPGIKDLNVRRRQIPYLERPKSCG